MRALAAAVLALLLSSACDERTLTPERPKVAPSPPAATPAGVASPAAPRNRPTDDPARVRALVEAFGERLRNVQLLAAAGPLEGALRREYGAFVTRELLAAWLRAPVGAPGRTTSSPWPARLEVLRLRAAPDGGYRVVAELVEAAADDDAVRRIPVALEVVRAGDAWRIASWSPSAPLTPGAPVPAAGAVAVVEAYYAAVARGEYERAHALWASDGAASGQTLEELRAGYADTARVTVETGEPGRVEPAAGSRYVEVPVTIRATTSAGTAQAFQGAYVLRRAVVDGATDEQRSWRIASARIVEGAG